MTGPFPAVDPRFGAELRRLRTERGMSLRELASRVHHGKTLVWEWESGRKRPHPRDAELLDDVLGAAGRLAALAAPPVPAASPVDGDRLRHVAERPYTLDRSTIDALHRVLADLRRLEDALGAAPLITAAAGPLRLVNTLAEDARGAVRPAMVDLAGQWAQFVGWLHAATGRHAEARQWYARSLEHAVEAGNEDLVATALSMRGHLAWLVRQPGPMVELSAAALRQNASPGVRALAAQQQARGYAVMGNASDTERCLDRAQELMAEAAEHPDDEPAWVYFYSPGYLTMQRGLAYRLLGRHHAAIEALTAGLAEIPADVRRADYVTSYVRHLAAAHQAAGNLDEARRLLADDHATPATGP